MKAYYNEIDPYCCKVLEKQIKAGNLPQGDVDCRDIRDVKGDELRGYGQKHLFAGIGGIPLGFQWAGMPAGFDIITGGFPCQDISTAGNRAGIDGARSGLWAEYHRLICELRPGVVFVENVAALLTLGIERVLGDLAASGYDAEWRCLRASDFGALHRRDRIWIVAYPQHDGLHGTEDGRGDAEALRRTAQGQNSSIESQRVRHTRVLAYAECSERRPECEARDGLARQVCVPQREESTGGTRSGGEEICDPASSGLPDWAGGEMGQPRPLTEFERPGGREIERDFRGVAHGVSRRVDRLKGLGNSVVPQIAEWIAKRILAANGGGD